jgi:hypothetical protein
MRRGRGDDEGGFVRMEDDDESVEKVDGDGGGGGRMGWGWEGWKRWMVNEGKRLRVLRDREIKGSPLTCV